MTSRTLLLITIGCAASVSLIGHTAAKNPTSQSSAVKPLAGEQSTARIVDSGDHDQLSKGYTGIAFRRLQDGSTVIEVEPGVSPRLRGNDLFFNSDAKLIKVGNVYAKGANIQELNELLPGSVNSSIELTILAGDQLITKVLPRYAEKVLYEGSGTFSSLLSISSLFSGWHGGNEGFSESGRGFQMSGNNLTAAPYFIASISCPKFLQPSFYDDYNDGLPAAMEFFARTGMFDRFDAASSRCLQLANSKVASCGDVDAVMLTKAATVMARYGCAARAGTISDKIYTLLPGLTAQTKVRVLRGRAALLRSKGAKGDALDMYRQLAVLCATQSRLPRQLLVETLQNIVEGTIELNEPQLAESSQLQLVELQRERHGSWRHLLYQDLVAALLQLADVYQLLGNYDKAQSTLQEALSTYENKLNAQEQILLERSGTPCPSDVMLHLAYLDSSKQDFDSAVKHLDSADKAIGDALGVTANSCKMIAAVKAKVVAAKASKNVEQLSSDFQVLLKPKMSYASDAEAIREAMDCLAARQVYDRWGTNSGGALTLLNGLISSEVGKSVHASDDINRLINLIVGFAKVGDPHKSRAMLRELNPCFSKGNEALSTNRLLQLTEIALLSEPNGNAASDISPAWKEVEQVLSDMEQTQFYSGAQISEFEDKQRRFLRLICLSNYFAFVDQPGSALRILEYGTCTYPAVAQRDPSVNVYKTILYLLNNNISQANALISASNPPKDGSNSEYTQMLMLLSNILYQTGCPELSLKVVGGESTESEKHPRGMLAYQRAMIEYLLGKYKEALAELSVENESGGLPSGQLLNLRYLRAELLARTGQKEQAVRAFIRLSNIRRQSARPFARALELSKSMSSISVETVQALVDGVSNLPWSEAGGENLQDMKYIMTLAKSHNIAADKLGVLEARMASSEAVHGPVDVALSNAKARAQGIEDARKPNASSEWANVARLCFANKQYSDGTACMLHALQIYSGENYNNGMYHPGNVRGDLGFTLLVKAKRYDDAERILKQCLETRQKGSWFNSGYIEKSLLAELYIEQGKYDEAQKWADALLDTFGADGGLCPPRGSSMRSYLFFTVVSEFIEKKQFEIAQRLLDSATRVQLSLVGPLNVLFIENYLCQAQLAEAQNNLPLAESFARKALEIEKFAGSSGNTGKICGERLAGILRKESKGLEADKISVLPNKVASRKVDLVKLYNIHMISSHMRFPERYADTAEEPLKEAMADAVQASGEGNIDSRRAMDNLTRFYVQQKRYAEAESLQLHQLKLLNEQYGKCAEPKFVCFLNLAEIYLLQGSPGKALSYAEQIKSTPEDSRYFVQHKSALRWANVLFSLGKKDKALDIGRKVEMELLKVPSAVGQEVDLWLIDCLNFMNRAGAVADADALRQHYLKLCGRQPSESAN